ncbi:carbohydrate ABC transporter permease [Actinospica robiniae]|uniref:carbohydrate ABC transporter permease n=1 Tax=Actinospica robiniae TaxID=304901 RepID=UPI0004123EF1|nr:sugar ABC transporter permease [Actinospica robiniae]
MNALQTQASPGRSTVRRGAPEKGTPRRRRVSALPYGLLAPAALILGLVVGYPLVRLVIISTQDFGLRALFTGTTPYIGFANYTSIWDDSQFTAVLVRTVVFAATLVAGTLAIGLGVALAMVRLGRRLRTVSTLCLICAWAMPTVPAALVWQWLFQPTYGVVNWLVSAVHVFGDQRQSDWLAQPVSAFVIIWLLVVWTSVPFVALTLYAGLSQIPAEYYEAAELDGAGFWRTFRVITVPFVRPILLLVTVLSVIWDFNVFNQIWLLTQGGPDGGTTTIGIWSFTKAFASQQYGQGAAIAVVSVILLAAMTGFWVRRLVKSGEEL